MGLLVVFGVLFREAIKEAIALIFASVSVMPGITGKRIIVSVVDRERVLRFSRIKSFGTRVYRIWWSRSISLRS